MTRPGRPDESIPDDLERLETLLAESYAETYRASSLKVRRRFRKLLTALEAERRQREHAPAFAANERPVAGLGR